MFLCVSVCSLTLSLSLTEPEEVFRMLRNMTVGTKAEHYFLSVLQHMLLIRDDYWARYVNNEHAYNYNIPIHIYISLVISLYMCTQILMLVCLHT